MTEKETEHKLNQAYHNMVQRLHQALKTAAPENLPHLEQLLMTAKEKAVELQEITSEEADKISAYVKSDIEDAAKYLEETGHELSDWLQFDLELVEEKLASMFSMMVDHTRLELDKLAERAAQASMKHTGEVTGPGTIICTQCDQKMHFHKPGHIPPCPKCHGTVFSRAE